MIFIEIAISLIFLHITKFLLQFFFSINIPLKSLEWYDSTKILMLDDWMLTEYLDFVHFDHSLYY